jgi:uncharacterized phiE125 gp8 family phage protein
MSLKLITAPASEPITTAEAKSHCHVIGTDDDTYIGTLIVAARQLAEQMTGRALLPQTWELALDEFPCEVIRLYHAPLIDVVSITYVADSGTVTTMVEIDDYEVDDYSEPARITAGYGTSWPSTRDQANAVLVRYQAGYANAAAVPQAIKSWMLMQIGAMYENREAFVNGTISQSLAGRFVDNLLDPFVIWAKK